MTDEYRDQAERECEDLKADMARTYERVVMAVMDCHRAEDERDAAELELSSLRARIICSDGGTAERTRLSSGREIGRQVIGIGPECDSTSYGGDGSLTSRRDGDGREIDHEVWSESYDEKTQAREPVTAEERRELAEIMCARWMAWAAMGADD